MSKKFINAPILMNLCREYLELNYITSTEYEEITNKILTCSDEIRKKLSDPESLKIYNELENLFMFSEGEASQNYFADGFRLGIAFALEILGFDAPNRFTLNT